MQGANHLMGLSGLGLPGLGLQGGLAGFGTGVNQLAPGLDPALLAELLGEMPASRTGSTGLPASAALQAEAQTIDALQQAILATINGGGPISGAMPGAPAPMPQLAPGFANPLANAQLLGSLGFNDAGTLPPAAATAPGGAGAGGGTGGAAGARGAPKEEPEASQSHKRGSVVSGRSAGTRTSDQDGDDPCDEEASRALQSAREKNRLAQRRFRERQKGTIAQQRDQIDAMGRQLEDYKREVQLLREENNILRAKLEGRVTLHEQMLGQVAM